MHRSQTPEITSKHNQTAHGKLTANNKRTANFPHLKTSSLNTPTPIVVIVLLAR